MSLDILLTKFVIGKLAAITTAIHIHVILTNKVILVIAERFVDLSKVVERFAAAADVEVQPVERFVLLQEVVTLHVPHVIEL